MKINTKKALCLLSMTAVITTGCADVTETNIITKDGKLTTDLSILAEKTASDELFQELSGTSFVTLGSVVPNLKTVEQSGKTYYSLNQKNETTISGMYDQKVSGEKIIQSMIASSGVTFDFTETSFHSDTTKLISEITEGENMSSSADALLNQQIKTKFSITFPYKVKDTNGTLSEDGYTVTFDDAKCKSGQQYAYTEQDYSLSGITSGGISGKNKVYFTDDIIVREGSKSLKSGAKLSDGSHILNTAKGDVNKTIFTVVDTTAPYFEGVKNNGYYNYALNFEANDNTTYVDSVTLDGKNIEDGYYMIRTAKDGKHTAIAKDAAGNTARCTFYIDKKKPVIKGAKNGKSYRKPVKIKCSDNRKLKSVTVNGKKKKSSFTLSKKGKYTITAKDQAGNKTKISIRIK